VQQARSGLAWGAVDLDGDSRVPVPQELLDAGQRDARPEEEGSGRVPQVVCRRSWNRMRRTWGLGQRLIDSSWLGIDHLLGHPPLSRRGAADTYYASASALRSELAASNTPYPLSPPLGLDSLCSSNTTAVDGKTSWVVLC
jgi:hypothetical protein